MTEIVFIYEYNTALHKRKEIYMKSIIPITKTLPVSQVLEVASKVLSHTKNMQQIKYEYRLRKQEMEQQYNIEMKALEYDMQRFVQMAKLQKMHFENGHAERMQILKMVGKIAKSLAKTTDKQLIEMQNQTLTILLAQCEESRQSTIGFIGTSKQPMLKGEF